MKRLAWLLFALTLVLVACCVVLLIVRLRRDLVLPDDSESPLLLFCLFVGTALLFGAVGLLVARAQPANAIGWIFLVAALLLLAMGSTWGYAELAIHGREGWPAANWAAWFGTWSLIPAVFVAPCLVAQLFPGGRPLPGAWRWVFWASVAVGVEATLMSSLAPGEIDSFPGTLNPVGLPDPLGRLVISLNEITDLLLAPPLLLASLAALVARFRGSRGILRLQMKWLAYAGALPLTAFAVAMFSSDVIFLLGFASLALTPIAVAIAILRYRLYEIDRLISKTLVYGALTVLLGAAYAGLVLAGQAVFSSFAGGSDLAIAVSTLVVAALFFPVRGRVQRFVDRRFYRRRYDAQRTVEAFGARLREQVDLGVLSGDLRGVATETMQPAHVSLWLRKVES